MHGGAGAERGPMAHPLAELLACPVEAAGLLNASVQALEFGMGEAIFRQGELCRGLYLVMSGRLLRKAERLKMRVVLGPVHVGELVELAAALGDGLHTFTLAAQTAGLLLMLPVDSLRQAFQMYPPMRMRLLEELAREVSRAYVASCALRKAMVVRRGCVGAIARLQ